MIELNSFRFVLSGEPQSTARELLKAVFGLSNEQLMMVIGWRLKFVESAAYVAALQKYSITSMDDLIYLQW